jgi:hypothetical protein
MFYHPKVYRKNMTQGISNRFIYITLDNYNQPKFGKCFRNLKLWGYQLWNKKFMFLFQQRLTNIHPEGKTSAWVKEWQHIENISTDEEIIYLVQILINAV